MKKISGNKKELSPERREELFGVLKTRFEKNMNRHKGLGWGEVRARLEASAEKLWSLNEMEKTGGEPPAAFSGASKILAGESRPGLFARATA